MNCFGVGCTLKHSCKRFTHPIDNEPYYNLSPVWNNECSFLFKDETMDEKLDAKNQEIRDRMKDMLG